MAANGCSELKRALVSFESALVCFGDTDTLKETLFGFEARQSELR